MKELLLHNWRLKVVSLAAALVLWRVAAPSPSSETGVTVPLEFRNIPPNTEVFEDTATSVEVRLRGPSSLLRTVSSSDVSLAIDLRGAEVGRERVLSLTPDLVQAPLGIDPVRVIPARVSFTVEQTLSKVVPIIAALEGAPQRGFEVELTTITPASVEIQGPASHVRPIVGISTAGILVAGKDSSFSQTVDLDVEDAVVRIPRSTSVKVDVKLRRSSP